ncbi:MAG: hypothetical protein K2N30_00110, partial [Clostridia bacterium]|nr:hypothetical protein [Clostridia bacterium]
MKYLRQIAVLVSSAIFVIAVAIGVCVIFSLRNVNITYVNYGRDDAEQTISQIKNKVLEKFEGSVISFIEKGEVESCIGDSYVMVSFEKVMPCT